MDFLERALSTTSLGVPVIRLRARTKIAMDSDWPSLATTDLETLKKWNEETPDANCAAVAKGGIDGVFFLEVDDPSVPGRIEAETGQKIPRTYRVRSRPGRGHYYWKNTPESLALGNVAQGYVRNGDFSLRVNSAYVVAANSLHPLSGLPYEVVSNCPIIECPNWLLDWVKGQRVEKKKLEDIPRDENNLIPHGYIHDILVSQAGKLINMGLPPDAVEASLLSFAHAQCAPPLDEDHIRQVARSTDKWKRGNPLDNLILVGGRVAGSEQTQTAATVAPSPQEMEEAVVIEPVPYPRFPEWSIKNTSIYDGLVRPFCEVNCRYPEFLWLPAVTILLNYLGQKVRIHNKNITPSLFSVLIGRRGKVIKSTSCEDAFRYFEYAGIVGHNESNSNNADGRSLIFTPSSPEGLGKEMQRTNCKNGVLFFDELATLVNKAGIETSNLSSTLLTLYESGKYQSLTKVAKDSFSLLPGSYTASLLACSTDKNFIQNWSKLAGKSTGLTDRFFFLLQPEVLNPLTPYIHVNTQEGALKTRQLIDKAIQKGVYEIVDSSPLCKFTAENNDSNRAEIRAEKFALALAVDSGSDEIDENHIEKALALVEYEGAVKKYLRTYEAQTKEGSIQMELMYHLRKAGGWMTSRDLQRVMNSARYGTTLWGQAYAGLIRSGWIREEGGGVKNEPRKVILLRVVEEDED